MMPALPRRILADWTRVTAASVLLTWAGAVGIFQAVDAFENLREYTRYGAGMGEVATFFLLRTPDLMFQILPAAVLLGSLLALFRLARHKELTAAEAAGLHPGWVYAVPLGVAAALAGLQLYLETGPLPESRALSDRFQATRIEDNPLRQPQQVRWKLTGDTLWRIANADRAAGAFTMETYRRHGGRLTVTRLGVVRSEGGAWRAGTAAVLTFPPLTATTAAAPAIPFLPEELQPIRPPANHLGLDEAWDLVRRKRRLAGEVTAAELNLHQRLSWLLLNLTVLLAALPYLPRHGRGTGTATGVLIALLIGIVGWATVVMGAAAATSQRMPAAYWLPHAILMLTGMAAWTRIRPGRARRRGRTRSEVRPNADEEGP